MKVASIEHIDQLTRIKGRFMYISHSKAKCCQPFIFSLILHTYSMTLILTYSVGALYDINYIHQTI